MANPTGSKTKYADSPGPGRPPIGESRSDRPRVGCSDKGESRVARRLVTTATEKWPSPLMSQDAGGTKLGLQAGRRLLKHRRRPKHHWVAVLLFIERSGFDQPRTSSEPPSPVA